MTKVKIIKSIYISYILTKKLLNFTYTKIINKYSNHISTNTVYESKIAFKIFNYKSEIVLNYLTGIRL